MKPKSIHVLYSETPNGNPEEHPDQFKWLERHIRSLERTKDKPFLDQTNKTEIKTPPEL
jgi:hypothetical protein